METPEYIEGIPTEKKKSPERRSLIEHYYDLLWKELQRENGTNGIFNPFLGVTVLIKKGVFASKKAIPELHQSSNSSVDMNLKIDANNI